MNRRSVLVALLLPLIVAPGVRAFNEPDGFRGVPWGATEEQMRATVSIERACADYPVTNRYLGDRYCPALLLIGDIKVRATYNFRGNRMTSVSLSFPSSNFDRLAEIFRERYGLATHSWAKALIWRGETTYVGLYRYLGTDITTGYARIATQAEMEQAERLREEQTKGAAKGL